MLGKIRKFAELPNSHKRLLAKIGIVVPLVELGIRTLGFKRTFRTLKLFAKDNKFPDENIDLTINHHRNFLYIFARQFPFFGNCLARALTLWIMLKNRGIDTDLRFGMKKENQKLLAHAWVEYLGKPLTTDREPAGNYVFFSESILAKVAK